MPFGGAIMANPPKSTKRSRLQAAGWVHVEGWLPPEHATWADQTRRGILAHKHEAERIANTPQPMGRPRKDPKP
jgi:hypothetical protein